MECISIELALSCACAWPGLSLWRLPVPQPTICVRRPSTLHLCTSSRSERKSNSSNGLWRPRDWRPRDSDWRPRDWRRRPRFGYDCPLLDGHRMAACVCVLCGASLYAVCLSFVFGPATHHATFTFKHSKGIDPRTWHVRGGGRAHRTPQSAPESGSSIGACGPRARAACCKRRGRGVCPSGFSQRSPPARQILHRSAGKRFKRGSRCRGISSQ